MGDDDAVKKILFRAPVLSQSGYGVHSRQIFRWLLTRSDVDVIVHAVQWGNTPWYIDKTAKDGFINEIMRCSKPDSGPWDISFQVQLPNEWDPKVAKFNVGITAGVETDVCNPKWVDAVNAMDLVIVPSKFTKSVLEKTGKLRDQGRFVVVIPESAPDAVVSNDAEPFGVEFTTKFNFLLVGQMTGNGYDNDRKNLFNTVKWFCSEFEGDEDVGLIIKTNSGRDTKIDRLATKSTLERLFSTVRKGTLPRIHFLHGSLTDYELAGLYKHPDVKALLSFTRGEGFGLPILEAAASDLPVIVTNWSGHTDFLSKGKFVKIDYTLKKIHNSRVDGNIFMDGAKWAEVSEQAARSKMRKFKEQSRIPNEWAVALGEKLRVSHSFEAVKLLYDGLWDELICG